jgi:ABC-type antimicrobial peptide transport system ATPase subunit
MFGIIPQMKQPAMNSRKKTTKILEEVLKENCYNTAPDALRMLDLTLKALGVEPDSIRIFLARTFAAPRPAADRVRMKVRKMEFSV